MWKRKALNLLFSLFILMVCKQDEIIKYEETILRVGNFMVACHLLSLKHLLNFVLCMYGTAQFKLYTRGGYTRVTTHYPRLNKNSEFGMYTSCCTQL